MSRNILFIILLSIFVLFNFNIKRAFPQKNSITLKLLGPIPNVQLKKGYAYYAFCANKYYLIWLEGYTHPLYVYNLAQEKVKKITLKQGRGPHEILQISGDAIGANNTIYLVDNRNIKFIRIKPKGTFLKDRISPKGLRPERLTMGNGYMVVSDISYMVVSDINSQQSLFYVKNNHTFIPIKISHYPERKYRNVYKLAGYQTIQGNDLIQVREYLPYFYIFNLKKKRLAKKIRFDDSEVNWGRKVQASNGAKILFPPSKVDILSRDIANVSGAPHCIFLLARGASKHRTYGKNKLFEYNYKKEKFVRTFKLPFKVEEIAVNNHYLFAYSKEKNKIYRWKIVHSK